MSPEAQGSELARPDYRKWLLGPFVFIAALVVVRFVGELAGMPANGARWFSSTGIVTLVAIYLGAVAPLRGVRRSWQLLLPGVALAAWQQLLVILATVAAGGLNLHSSHFAEPEDFGNWANIGRHVWGHTQDILPFAAALILLMGATFLLWRWPVTVGPGALLGGITMIRFWMDAMGVPNAAAASSTVAILLCGFYLPAAAPGTAKALLVPSLVLGWAWQLWVFIARLLAALVPYYKTHFFDPKQEHAAMALAWSLVPGVIEGAVAGLIVWGVAVWMSCATRRQAQAAGIGRAR